MKIKLYQLGGYVTPIEEREKIHNKYDPTGGADILQLLNNGNKAYGEQNEYWRMYLGLPNLVPNMKPYDKTSWDDKVEKEKIKKGEQPSEFYGITPRMERSLQALGDSLNLGKIHRNYDAYKIKYPDLASKEVVAETYNNSVNMMNNPNVWHQVDGDRLKIKEYGLKNSGNETNTMGMLRKFGMMWDKEKGRLRMHDTYDFTKMARIFSGVPDRPREAKIRGSVPFNPKKGSALLRGDLKDYNKYIDLINQDDVNSIEFHGRKFNNGR